MALKLILVEPKYQMNLGYAARVAKNFGINKLYIVSPRTKLTGKSAIMYSKHAHELLEKAKVYKRFEDAIADCDIVIGTTGMWQKAKSNFRNIYLVDQVVEKVKRLKKGKVAALVIGRDDIGLTKDELEMCDYVSHIATDENYPVLNLSHALAIFLFALHSNKLARNYKEIFIEKQDKRELEAMFKLFDKAIENKNIRDRVAVKRIFRRIISTSQPTRREIHAMMLALK